MLSSLFVFFLSFPNVCSFQHVQCENDFFLFLYGTHKLIRKSNFVLSFAFFVVTEINWGCFFLRPNGACFIAIVRWQCVSWDQINAISDKISTLFSKKRKHIHACKDPVKCAYLHPKHGFPFNFTPFCLCGVCCVVVAGSLFLLL